MHVFVVVVVVNFIICLLYRIFFISLIIAIRMCIGIICLMVYFMCCATTVTRGKETNVLNPVMSPTNEGGRIHANVW